MRKNRILNIAMETIIESFHGVGYFIKHNFVYIATIIELGTPYLMYVLCQALAKERGRFSLGGELFLPLVLWLVANFIRNVANKLNRGTRIPKPVTRFTDVDEDGLVSIEEDRFEEMLVYMADLEDWMERKGWL